MFVYCWTCQVVHAYIRYNKEMVTATTRTKHNFILLDTRVKFEETKCKIYVQKIKTKSP